MTTRDEKMPISTLGTNATLIHDHGGATGLWTASDIASMCTEALLRVVEGRCSHTVRRCSNYMFHVFGLGNLTTYEDHARTQRLRPKGQHPGHNAAHSLAVTIGRLRPKGQHPNTVAHKFTSPVYT